MGKRKWIRRAIVFCLMVFFSLIPAFSFAADRIGIVLMHGKTGSPVFMANAVGDTLQHSEILVETPEMPWSKRRYIDKTYEEALNEIDQAVERLREKGASKVVVAGHSMGGDAALAYAAYHGNIAGVILMAPGHTPDSMSFKKYQADVGKAKSMIDLGNGNKSATFNDSNMGVSYVRNMKAEIYYSYFNPEGLGAMSKAARVVNSNIPVLYIVGSLDPLTASLGKGYAFDKLPENKNTLYVTVNSDHLGTPAASRFVILDWLNELIKQ